MYNNLFTPKILVRDRVNSLLENIFSTPIFYLSASMGYGKTTAVRQFLETKKEYSVIWITISDADGDEKWLWHKLGHLIESYNPQFAEKLMQMDFPTEEYAIREVLEVMKEELQRPMVVVFDNYQNAKCGQLLDRILSLYTEYNMKSVHTVVISRMRPSSEFLMLNIKHKCMIMWQAEIAFSKEESRELFRLNGFQLEDKQLDELYSYTMGWIAPTYLLLLEYANHHNIGMITESTELVKVAIFDQLDEVSQRILLMLAPVDRFSLELGEYITRDRRTQSVIKEMLIKNCFINLIPQTKEYEFHTLFRYTLLEELRKSEIDKNEILNQCGKWYLMRGETLAAIRYFDKARNHEAILESLSKMGATEYIYIAPKLITEVMGHMSLEEKLSRPIGYLTFLLSYWLRSQSSEAYRMFHEAKEYYSEHQEIENWNHIMGEIYLIESLIYFGDAALMAECIQKAKENLIEGRSWIQGPEMIATNGKIHFMTRMYHKKGQYSAVKDFVVEHLGTYKQVTNGLTAGMRYLVNAEYAYDTGDLETAKILAYKSIYKAETKNQLCVILDAYFVLMRISYVLEKENEIEQYMEEIDQRMVGRKHPIIRVVADMIKGYIYGVSRHYSRIPEWNKSLDMSKGIDSLLNTEEIPINLGLVLLCKKEYIQLEVFMEASIEEYKKSKSLYSVIYAYILSAIAKAQLYDEDEAMEALSLAMDIAEPDNIILPFIEFMKDIKEVLELMAEQSEFARRILTYYKRIDRQGHREIDYKQGVQDLLTDREKEVMSLFVKGYKQSEIAKELQITIDTVKRHIKNVYGKLNIHSKAELIEKLSQRHE